jgi:hypothetical protein
MPFAPDYSDFLRMKKIQKTFEIDRQVDSTKFRATQPYGGYTPTYRIGYLPPNLFLPGRLYLPAPEPTPSGPVSLEIDVDGHDFGGSPPDYNIESITFTETTVLNITIINAVNIDQCINFRLANAVYDFTGTTASISPEINPLNDNSIVFGSAEFGTGEILGNSSVITIIFPTPLSSLDSIQLNF